MDSSCAPTIERRRKWTIFWPTKRRGQRCFLEAKFEFEQVEHFTLFQIIGAHSLEEMVSKLKKPRRVMMLVKAGEAVDQFIDKLVPLLQPGDIIIDGGNSQYLDSNVSVFSFDFDTGIGFSFKI